MAKRREHHPTDWMPEHVAELMRLSRDNLSAREIALELGRTEEAVQVKARQLGVIISSGPLQS